MKRLLSSVAVAAALLLGSVVPAQSAMLVVPLKAVGGTGQNGRAVLTDLPGMPHRVKVTMTVAAEPPLAIEPSHIHRGVCGSNGPILKPLTNVVHGSSASFIVGVTTAQLHAMHTYINIHKSAQMLSVIVSCGNI